MLEMLTRALDRLSMLALALSAVGVVAMTAIVGWQVFGRYVLNDTPIWSERLSVFLMMWYILLAAAVGVHERFHIGLVFVRERLPRTGKIAAELIVHAVILGFAAAMIYYGTRLAQTTWSHTIPTLGLPRGLAYVAFPVSGALMILFTLRHVAALLAYGPAPDGAALAGARAGAADDAPESAA